MPQLSPARHPWKGPPLRPHFPACNQKKYGGQISTEECRIFYNARYFLAGFGGGLILKSLGLASAIGIILGIVMTWWVKPDTNAGAVFIVVTMVLICVVIGAIANFLFNFRKSPDHEVPDKNR
jgi:hypothetical protein